jgi:hypothetical protein
MIELRVRLNQCLLSLGLLENFSYNGINYIGISHRMKSRQIDLNISEHYSSELEPPRLNLDIRTHNVLDYYEIEGLLSSSFKENGLEDYVILSQQRPMVKPSIPLRYEKA